MSSRNDKYLALRVGSELKEDFQKFCKNKGYTMSKAVQIYIKYCLENGFTSYNIVETDKYDEDDTLISVSINIDIELRQKFSDACKENDISMSILVRNFMKECAVNNKFPFDKK